MKPTNNNPDDIRPKLGNINDEKETPKEVPAGADIRLKILAFIILAIAIFIGVKGAFTKMSLGSQITEQKDLLIEAKKTASEYGITEDEDGNLIVPDMDADMANKNQNINENDTRTLDSFAKLLLTWRGQSGYNKVRQTLIDEWGFSNDCKLLSSFMPETGEELNANMSLSNYATFVTSEDESGTGYFLICTVRNTIDGASASGIVGLQIRLDKESKITNVTAQTIA